MVVDGSEVVNSGVVVVAIGFVFVNFGFFLLSWLATGRILAPLGGRLFDSFVSFVAML